MELQKKDDLVFDRVQIQDHLLDVVFKVSSSKLFFVYLAKFDKPFCVFNDEIGRYISFSEALEIIPPDIKKKFIFILDLFT